ncbi:uncharacterized protein At5g03900, chloroplastic isoform X1 [Olea europaea subsp. europaea]|uniref:Uncharacterized protein At5g03900, chloroplastic isoform X1 n=1 Tax=Olea europaea subsp. europaea TaxID=158383 RepID=A0A8S0UEN8_OLEEU|nr:uncharacterized protein At5g03900, chloroplastic isoform X1 [Olea europaea subsp. europaea]
MASISTYFLTLTPKTHSLTLSHKAFKPPQLHYLPPPFLPTSVKYQCHNRRNSVVLIRASSSSGIDVTTSAIKPGGIVESDKLSSEVRKRAMDAIDSFGGRVTIGDVASKAGLKLNEAQKALQAVAADTNGFLEVSDEGDVLYVFPKDYRSKLAAKSFKIKIEPLFEKVKMATEYVVRVSFGTALIASIVLVYTTIIAILSSSRYNFSTLHKHFMSIINYMHSMHSHLLISNINSFLFLRCIGQYIASNGGVVTAEELAPYLDVETTENMDDDSYILPVLLRFDGQPEIDDEGNILYRFPSLQRTAAPQRSRQKEYVGRRWADWVGGVEKFFKEKKWQFSKTNASEKAMVIGLGGLNLFGVVILSTMLKNMKTSPSGFISFVSDIVPLLQIYAGSFFAIPLVRWFFVQKTNADIDKRNQARSKRSRALESPDLSLRQKLLSARDMAQRTFIGQDRIVYSTDKDLYEQDYEAREWDRRLKEIENSD